MTDDRMNLRTLLEKSPDADFLREMTRLREAASAGEARSALPPSA